VAVELVFGDAEPVRSDDDRELIAALRSFQEALWRHPMAVQTVFSALVREGREYAKTPEGAALQDGLSRSPSLARARMIWEVLSLSAFVEKPDGALPSVFLETLLRGVKVGAIEPLLSRLFERRGKKQ
jgi:hypothetical protein